ncbi:MAG: hypothetical protein ACLTDM_07115 [Clostridium butyricum]
MDRNDYFSKANEEYNKGEYEKAIELYKKITLEDDYIGDVALYNIGVSNIRLYLKTNEENYAKQAIDTLLCAFERNPFNTRAIFNLGYMYEAAPDKMRDEKKAYNYFKLCRAINETKGIDDPDVDKAIMLLENRLNIIQRCENEN